MIFFQRKSNNIIKEKIKKIIDIMDIINIIYSNNMTLLYKEFYTLPKPLEKMLKWYLSI